MDVNQFIHGGMAQYYQQRIEFLKNLKLDQIIVEVNPYLLRVKNDRWVSALIEKTLGHFLLSSEETHFSEFLKDLGIFVALKTTGGCESDFPGVDLEFEDKGELYIVAIQGGPDLDDSSSNSCIEEDLINAEHQLRQSKQIHLVRKVLGFCYGKSQTVALDDGFIRLSGQNFWALISGNLNFYTDIIKSIGYGAYQNEEDYLGEFAAKLNMLTYQFTDQYCHPDYSINWTKITQANSGNYALLLPIEKKYIHV
jgi:hypothetical protein